MNERLERGKATLAQLDPEAGERMVAELEGIAPDLGRYILEFAFGDVYSRPGLSPQQRQIVTLGILTALGSLERPLGIHVGSALNVGVSPEEIVEVLIHAVPYVGVPRVRSAMFIAHEVFETRGVRVKTDVAQ